MIYKDYVWTAAADIDNPQIIGGNDHRLLNRSEGYEVLYFIRSVARSWNWKDDAIKGCQKVEKTIRTKVPDNIRTHSGIKSWIEQNFNDFWNDL